MNYDDQSRVPPNLLVTDDPAEIYAWEDAHIQRDPQVRFVVHHRGKLVPRFVGHLGRCDGTCSKLN